ncbi:nucleotide-binding universal stress UspA family protein [Streptomyces puniciscabiei]|uniref:Nucleotide-binding universal stress UspA family protein n=1 Tax=Streptomyces puniciscabiei TaxID=164348 RepID=A0A542TI95_9ACTN|nr:universal stress protein [Streptomyces puniciscabiei]TQK86447.1 nucleotide-binding universal stress UspA family protein [Streptomyces puniciscabiei]
MNLPIVVGVDGSEPSLRAVDWAADEAVLRGASLRLVYASLWDRYEGALLAQELDKPLEEVMARDVVGTAQEQARRRRPEVTVTTDVLPEEPEQGLVRESGSALAVVLGCRGRSGMGEALLGSVSLAVAGHAHCPVIVLRGSDDNRSRTGIRGRIAVGVGEKPAGSAAVRFAVEEAALRGVPLEAVRAWRRPAPTTVGHPAARLQRQQAVELLEQALRDTPAEPRIDRRTVEGHARDALIAASREADLLVLGARRRHGHFGLPLGRVAHGVLHHAACPVAVVPEPA